MRGGVTTKAHHLVGVDEIYLIVKGEGEVKIGDLEATEVKAGDTVFIPAVESQRITNSSKSDLIFYCICTPKFTSKCYYDEEARQQSTGENIP